MSEPRKDFGVYEKIVFISDLLSKQTEIRNMLDVRSNIIVGFNSALIVFLLANFHESLMNNIVVLIVMATSIFSLFLIILALKPPTFLTKKGQKESIFYHHHIEKCTPEEFRKEVYKTLDHENNIFDAYAEEIYNITKFSNIPRKHYLNTSIKVLIFGMALAVFIYFLYLIGVISLNTGSVVQF